MIQGDLRHIDGSTTITNRDAFNIENTVTEQQLPPTASLMIVGTEGKFIPWVLKASRVIYNGLIQRQLPWYLRIPLLHVKHKIQAELQVRDKFQWTSEFALTSCLCMPDMPSGTRGSRHVEMAVSVPSTVSKFKHSGTCFYADINTFGRRLQNLVLMNEDPIASSQHRSRRIGSNLFVRKLKDGLKKTL